MSPLRRDLSCLACLAVGQSHGPTAMDIEDARRQKGALEALDFMAQSYATMHSVVLNTLQSQQQSRPYEQRTGNPV
jgi:hypothetical protein